LKAATVTSIAVAIIAGGYRTSTGTSSSPSMMPLIVSFIPAPPTTNMPSPSRPACLRAATTPMAISSSCAQTASMSGKRLRKSCITSKPSSRFQLACL
jgi:hypothetical protein